MDGKTYIKPRLGRLGVGLIFKVSVLQLKVKEYPGKITHGNYIIRILATVTIEFKHQLPIKSESSWLLG